MAKLVDRSDGMQDVALARVFQEAHEADRGPPLSRELGECEACRPCHGVHVASRGSEDEPCRKTRREPGCESYRGAAEKPDGEAEREAERYPSGEPYCEPDRA